MMRMALRVMVVASAMVAQFTISPIHAQVAAPVTVAAPIAELDELETRTMRIVTSGTARIGTQVMGNNPMMSGRTAELSILDSQIAGQLPVYGPIIGWERVGERRIGGYLVNRRYIVRHERMLTVWYLTFVSTTRGWEVAGLSFNDQLQTLDADW
jgi:hypothetical protein